MNSFSDYIIKKDVVINNLKYFKNYCNKAKICAVVKANAYGLGVKNISKLIDKRIDFYAVSCFLEAKELRKFTYKPILILNFVPYNNIKFCLDKNISITVYSVNHLKIIEKFLQKLNNLDAKNKLKIHLAINSGMNRIGFDAKNDFLQALDIIKRLSDKIILEGIFTHFFNAEDITITKKQISIFNKYIKILSKYFDLSNIIKHVCNSLGAIKYPSFNFDMVRVGIGLYTNLDVKKQKNKNVKQIKSCIEDSIELTSKIIKISHIKKGEYVGYGKTFQAKRDMTIGTIPLGYADGIFRNYAKQGKVICNGKFCKIVGNICMDMFMIDLSKTRAKLFDRVIIIGKDKFGKKISIENIAKDCNTISYEILTSIKKSRLNFKIK